MLQDNAPNSGFQTELISPVPTFGVGPNERPAPIDDLSLAKRNALVACLNTGGLYRKAGAWHGSCGGKPLSGVTIADLARDGLLTVTKTDRVGSAQLTKRGTWFARTVLRHHELRMEGAT
jgi:hypothetical protein